MCPLNYVFFKFRILGFMHLKRLRPISNLKYILYEDVDIIRYFGYFSYCFLNWFRCVDNFSKVKFFIEFLRESCFLTLSRKHNKKKTWSYSIYTSNLLLSKNLYNKKSFFPTKQLLLSIKKKFLLDTLDLFWWKNILE